MDHLHKRSSFCNRQLELRDGEENPKFFGYASVFYDGTPATEYRIWDDYVERIIPGCFDRALQEKHDVRCLFNHDSSIILGRTSSGTLRLSIDAVGLYYECQYNSKDPDHERVREKLGRKDVTGSSFQFVPTAWNTREEGDLIICEIADCDLYDVGPVTYPAYAGAASSQRACRSEDAKQSRDELVAIKERLQKQRSALAERRKVILDQKRYLMNL